jgi:integrase
MSADRHERYRGGVPTGIRQVHSRRCLRRDDRAAACKCRPTYEAWVYDAAAGRKMYRSFPTERAAKRWRRDTSSAVDHGRLTAAESPTVREAGDALIAAMRTGSARNRQGRPFKPSVVEGYAASLRDWVYPALGARRLAEVRRQHVQALADALAGENKSPSTIRNVLMPLRVVYRRAIRAGVVSVNPTTDLELPAMTGRRDRFATPVEAAALVDALEPRDRAAWALALYAGLRLGELRALRWSDLHLDEGGLHVRQAWCNRTKQVTSPKTPAAERTVPVAGELRRILLEHRMLTGRVADGLVIARADGGVESADALQDRATAAWNAAKITGLTMHDARHGFASLMIAAGVQPKALQTFMGHASITTTFDRYGHLYPTERRAAAQALDRLLEGGA